jgi:3-isopropylmalate/(R)-2-methylmalate dehydratase small subunit
LDYGFRVIIAPSFADIFYNNSLKTGLLPVSLSSKDVGLLIERTGSADNYTITVDLETASIRDDQGFERAFEIDVFRKYCLLNGLDDIGLTLQHEDRISTYEQKVQQTQPFLAFSN